MCMRPGCTGKSVGGKKSSSSTRNATRNAYTPPASARGAGFGSPAVKIKFGGKK